MRAEFLPYIFAIAVLLACFGSYGIAVSFKHVPAFLPYISDTGVFVPERSVFSLLINVAAFVHMITIYVRFEQVQAELKWRHRNKNLIGEKKLRFLNKLSLPIGLGISFGLCLLGNFQLHSQRTLAGTDGSGQLTKEEYIVQKIHWFGAFLTYMGGNIYMFIQTIISIVLSLGTKKGQWRRRTAFLRLVISILTATLIAAGIGTGISSATHSDEDTGTIKWKDTAKTSDTDSKGKLSLTSVLCEWLSTLLILVYTVTMVPEFRLFRISKPQVTIVMDRHPHASELRINNTCPTDATLDATNVCLTQLA